MWCHVLLLWKYFFSITHVLYYNNIIWLFFSLHTTIAEIMKQVLDRCVVGDPKTQDPKNKHFTVLYDYSFVEDHQDKHTRWLVYYCSL